MQVISESSPPSSKSSISSSIWEQGLEGKHFVAREQLSTKVAYLVLTQLPWVQFYSFPISQAILEEQLLMSQRSIHWRWLEESGLWFENVDRTNLVLASGK